jgi:hypothetical protein
VQNQADQKQSWEEKRIQYIAGLKRPTEAQQLLALLFQKPDRTADEAKKLAVLLKAERATVRAMEATATITKMMSSAKDEERRARNHRLILQGSLFDLAGLETISRGEMLGALLAVASTAKNKPETLAEWKRHGDALLAEKEAKNKTQDS